MSFDRNPLAGGEQDSPSLWRLRLRRFVGEWQYVLLAAFLIVGLLGGVATYQAHVDPGTERVEETVSTWSLTGQYDHSATVRRSNPVFPAGATLQNRSVYYSTVTPVASIEPTVGYQASEGSLTLDLSTELVFRRVSTGDDGGSTVYWEERESLESRTVQGLEPGTSASVPLSLNIPELRSQSQTLSEQVGGPGETRVLLITQARTDGTVGGEPVSLTRQYTTRIQLSEEYYQVADAAPSTETFERTNVITRPRDPGMLTAGGGPLGVVVGLLGLVSVYLIKRKTPLSDDEQAYLQFASEREKFEEWLHDVRLPEIVRDRPQAEAGSLSDLVDVAIDTDNAVHVERRDGTEVFTVPHGDILYVYKAPSIGSRSADSGSENTDNKSEA